MVNYILKNISIKFVFRQVSLIQYLKGQMLPAVVIFVVGSVVVPVVVSGTVPVVVSGIVPVVVSAVMMD